jgi:flagellar biogenesis protein FliO
MERGMQFMTTLFGGTTNTLLNSAFALGIVLAMIVLGVWALKLLTKATGNLARSKEKRLVVVDKAMVDAKRQVVIIRRDNVEHVIMTGGPTDVIIESGVAVPEPPPAFNRRQRTAPAQPDAKAETVVRTSPGAFDEPIPEPERPVSRDTVDRLHDLARPAPLKPRTATPPGRPATSLRHTNLLRSVRGEADVVHIAPALRVDNTAGAASDSATSGHVETGGQTRVVARSRFFRGIRRSDGN